MAYIRETHFRLSVFVCGVTGMLAQIICFRAFYVAYEGNELALGIILGNWLLVHASGAYLGIKISGSQHLQGFLFSSQLLTGILPLTTLFLIYYTRHLFFPPGMMISLMDIFLLSLALLIPLCFITGFLFSFLTIHLTSQAYTNKNLKCLTLKTIGGTSGGVVFTILLLFSVDAFVALKFLMAINFVMALFVTYGFRSALIPRITGILAIILAGFFFMIHLKPVAESYLYKYQNIVHEKETIYGNLVVTEMAGQHSFFENGIFLYATNNTINNEESVHYAMLQHPRPENVLLISGGMTGAIAEVLKYDVKSLDYLEINPGLIEVGKTFLTELKVDDRVRIISQDPRAYLKKNNKVYDVVLINLPDPVNIRVNNYYTLEFFEDVKDNLSGTGIISSSLSSTGIYLSDDAKLLHSSLLSNLKLLFTNVVIIPGMNNYFIASDALVSSNLGLLSRYKSINNTYVNSFYLDDELINERRNRIENLVSDQMVMNYDFLPLIHVLQLKQWLRDINIWTGIAGAILLVIMILIIPGSNTVQIGLLTTGFTASSLQILLIVTFQIFYGYVYAMIGVFFTIFMTGILIGIVFVPGRFKVNFLSYSVIQYLSGILTVIVPITLLLMDSGYPDKVIIHTLFVLFIMFSGILTGLHFTAGSQLIIPGTSNKILKSYILGLFGAGVGTLAVSAFLIPYFGIIKVGLLLGMINFLVGLFILLNTRKIRIT
jgi:spermidine synthase